VVREITGVPAINSLGFCVGGTILATALAVLAARGEQPANSVTLLTSLLDFSDNGVLDVFIDEPSVQLREMSIGARRRTAPAAQGSELATTFSFLRPTTWCGTMSSATTSRAKRRRRSICCTGTGLDQPAGRCSAGTAPYLLAEDLRQPGKLKVCGEAVDLGSIAARYSSTARARPYRALDGGLPVYRRAQGKKRFVLALGHIAGVINPAAKNSAATGQRQTAGQGTGLVRWRHREAGQLVPSVRLARRTWRQADRRAEVVWRRKYKAIEPRPVAMSSRRPEMLTPRSLRSLPPAWG